MSIQIELSDEQLQRATARAAELGHPTVESYVPSLISSDIEETISEELEAELLKAPEQPAREITPAEWEEKRRRLIERYGRSKAG